MNARKRKGMQSVESAGLLMGDGHTPVGKPVN